MVLWLAVSSIHNFIIPTYVICMSVYLVTDIVIRRLPSSIVFQLSEFQVRMVS